MGHFQVAGSIRNANQQSRYTSLSYAGFLQRSDELLNMFNSLRYRTRLNLASLRRKLPLYRFTWHGDHLAFCALICLPIVALGTIFRFAYVDQVRIRTEQQRRTDLNCLARNIYYEARGEPAAGQLAVAEVTMNRVESSRFPNSVCSVVHEQNWDKRRERYVGAFSWTEFDALPRPRGESWRRSMDAAVAVYDEQAVPRVPGALFYHATSITPRWSVNMEPVAEIGRHTFY